MSLLIAEFGDCKLYKVPATTAKDDSMQLPKGMNHIEVRRKKKTANEEEQIYRSDLLFPENQVTGAPGDYVDESFEEWLRESVQYRPSDVVITTFPKCGTTFTEQIVLLLLNEGDIHKLDPLSKNSYHLSKTQVGKVWPEGTVVPNDYTEQFAPGRPPYEEFFTLPLDKFESIPNPRVIKSHASIHHVLGGTTASSSSAEDHHPNPVVQLAPAKYIVVTRNIFDACVSAYYHAFNPYEKGWPFEVWALMFLEGYSEPSCGGSYFDWNKGWKEMETYYNSNNTTGGPQILWIHYEDLLHSTRENVIRIAKFIGVDPTDKLIDLVVEGSSFQKMKAKADERKNVDQDRKMTSGHLRKGKAGDWRNYFSKDLEDLFRQRYKEKMGDSKTTGLVYSLGNDEILE